MAQLFASGRIIDGIVVLMVLEMIVLIIVRKKTHSGLHSVGLAASLAAGAALLLALRAALTGSPWQAIAGLLLVALIAHLTDLKLRWRAR